MPGATILLHAEQGFGDVIQFMRYAPMVRERCARVVFAAPPALTRLLRGVDGIDEVVAVGSLPPFDAFCPVASLPGVFGTTIATIPGQRPYLSAPPSSPRSCGPLRVGLVWSGNPGFVNDAERSIDPAILATLAGVPGVEFHSLQHGGTPPFPMHDRMPGAHDFLGTAALVAELDLVVAVDTAVAHLAAAMGRPVWLLSRHMGCWRWMRAGEGSPWYPTVRIFRQNRPGDWPEVLARVRAALRLAADGGCV